MAARRDALHDLRPAVAALVVRHRARERRDLGRERLRVVVDALDAEALLRRADHAMYSAKNAGKNQLAMAAAAQPQDA